MYVIVVPCGVFEYIHQVVIVVYKLSAPVLAECLKSYHLILFVLLSLVLKVTLIFFLKY